MSRVLDAFLRPMLITRDVSDLSGLSFATVLAAIEGLESLGILREISRKRRGRIYVCMPMMETLFAPTKQ